MWQSYCQMKNSYLTIDQDCLVSLFNPDFQEHNRRREREGDGTLLYSMQIVRLIVAIPNKTMTYNELIIGNLIYLKIINKKRREREGEALPILRRFCINEQRIVNFDNGLQHANNSYGMTSN
jgi:hypothetical protein